jgi:hypothetical protein
MKVEDVTDMLRLEARPITASVNDVSLHFATCGAAWSAVAGAARIDQAEAALMSLIPDT